MLQKAKLGNWTKTSCLEAPRNWVPLLSKRRVAIASSRYRKDFFVARARTRKDFVPCAVSRLTTPNFTRTQMCRLSLQFDCSLSSLSYDFCRLWRLASHCFCATLICFVLNPPPASYMMVSVQANDKVIPLSRFLHSPCAAFQGFDVSLSLRFLFWIWLSPAINRACIVFTLSRAQMRWILWG